MELSNRQKLILSAVRKMEEGEKIFKEGSIEFDQLTGGEEGKKTGSGGQDVTTQIHRVSSKIKRRSKRSKKKVWSPNLDQDFLNVILDAVKKNNNEPFVTAHWVAKKYKIAGGWTKVNAAVKQLTESNRLTIINKPRYPGSSVIAKCLSLP